jgi:GT2 family glycosyltransferase
LFKLIHKLARKFSTGQRSATEYTRATINVDVKKLYQELIDINWMAARYADLKIDASELEDLFQNGIDPNQFFDSDWYLLENKDLTNSGIDPLMHYVTFGENEGRKPNPFFDPVTYLRKYPELRDFQGTLLAHFIDFGIKQGKTSATVDNSAEFESARKLALVNLDKHADLFAAQKIAVVIPAYNNWSFTERCIRAIEKTVDYPILQIFVVNDGSTDETLREVARYPYVTVIHIPVNSGYLNACNFAFTQLREFQFLFLLNNDSEPNSGFVLNALDVMQSNEDAAVVGSTLFSSDGRLQAAGGMVGSDGTCRNWGNLDETKSSRFRYTRKIDYVPFAAALVRSSELMKIRGFDERFAPAYYEDVDLAFQMREIGKSVYISSESTIFHFGSKSYGLGGNDSLIEMNHANKKKFHDKWRMVLNAPPFSQSRVPLQPAIEEHDRSIVWSSSHIESDSLCENDLRIMNYSMRQGYRVIYMTEERSSARFDLANFRNNGIQVIRNRSEIESYKSGLDNPDHVCSSREAKLVFEEVENEIYFESENARLSANKIAVLAQWSESEHLSYSAEKLIQELLACDFQVVLVSACESKERLVISHNLRNQITILRKPNFGYDFGSWSVALQAIPEIKLADEVILMNDSLIGPFSNLTKILEAMKNSSFDITGLTDSLEFSHHIQSYMMHFKNDSLRDQAIWSFWRNVKDLGERDSVIRSYELGLSRLAVENGFYIGAMFPFNITPDRRGASSKLNALSLIESGFPFVKFNLFHQLDPTKAKELKELVGQRFDLAAHELEEFFPASND